MAWSGPLPREKYLEAFPDEPRHFLDAEDNACDAPTDELLAEIRDRAREMDGIARTSGLGPEWERLYRETLGWHYPHRGGWDGAEEFFRWKTAWASTLLSNREWARDPDRVELALPPLEELKEWLMPHPTHFPYPDQPGRDVLRSAGVESFEELTDEVQRAAWQKAVADARRSQALGHLQLVLQQLDGELTDALRHCCKRGIHDAQQAGDAPSLARWQELDRRLGRESSPAGDWDDWWKF